MFALITILTLFLNNYVKSQGIVLDSRNPGVLQCLDLDEYTTGCESIDITCRIYPDKKMCEYKNVPDFFVFITIEKNSEIHVKLLPKDAAQKYVLLFVILCMFTIFHWFLSFSLLTS